MNETKHNIEMFVWIVAREESHGPSVITVGDEDFMHEVLDETPGILHACALPESQWRELTAEPNWMNRAAYQGSLIE